MDINSFHIELSTYCNASCLLCWRQYLTPHPIHLDFNKFKTYFNRDVLSTINNFVLCGTYGEPTLHPDFLNIYKYIKTINPDLVVSIHSNASTHTPEWWKELGEILYDNDNVFMALNGTEKTHSIYRTTDFYKVFNNIKSLSSIFPHVHIKTILFDHNYDDIPNLKKILEPLNIEYHDIQRSYLYNDQFKEPPEIKDRDITSTNRCVQCFLRGMSLYLNADGNITPCCFINSYNNRPMFVNKSGVTSDFVKLYLTNKSLLTIDNNHFDLINNEFLQYTSDNIFNLNVCSQCVN